MKRLTVHKIKTHWKRYLISSLVTFVAGFCMAVIPEIDALTLEGVKTGALLGVVFAGLRAGVKMVLEFVLHSTGDVVDKSGM